MPYDSIDAAKNAGFPTSAEDLDLTLAQINKLAEIYDAIKEAGTADNPMAVAWGQWKDLYKKEGTVWVEQAGNRHIHLGHNRLSIQDLSMIEQGNRLDEVFKDYRKEVEQVDDVVIIGVKA